MPLGQESFVFEISDEITAAQSMANAKKDPFVPQLEHIWAGDIFIPSNSELFLVEIRMKQLAKVGPPL